MDPNNQTQQTDDEVVYCTPDPQTGRQPEYYASEQPVHAATSEPEQRVPIEIETEPESDATRRRGRSTGETYRKRNKDPTNRVIEFGPDGNKIGPATGPFANSLGQIARDHVPIIYPNWKKVPEKTKNDCWLKIKEEWPTLPDRKKDVVLKSLGNRWKEHKSKLHRNYVLSENDEDPRARYHIPPNHWDEFVRHCNTDEFKKKSAQGREAARKNLYPHRLGSGGYASARRRWNPSTVIAPSDPSSTAISSQLDPRSRDWMLARAKRIDQGVAVIDDPTVLQIQRRVEEKIREASDGTFVPRGSNDVLTAALGTPEHPGRTRAHSTDFTRRKDVFGKPKRSRRAASHAGCFSQQDVDEIKRDFTAQLSRQREEMEAAVNEKFQKWVESIAVQGNLQQVLRGGDPPPATGSSAAPSPHGPPPPGKKRFVRCRLFMLAADQQVEVAVGRVFEYVPGDKCHHREIGENERKVQIDLIHDHCRIYPLPIPHPDLRDLMDALGSFILWPVELIVPDSDEGSGVSAPRSARREKRAPILSDAVVQELPPKCRQLYQVLMSTPESDNTFAVYYLEEELGIAGESHVTTGAIVEMLSWDWLELTILQVFSIASARRVKELMLDRYRFPDPYRCSAQHIADESDYLTDFIERVELESFVLLPYHQGNHWWLLILHLAESRCYCMDSLHNNEKTRFVIAPYLNIAFRNFWAKRGEDPKTKRLYWKFITGPLQPSGSECGYYVMRAMHDIINTSYDATTLPEVMGSGVYGVQQLDEVRDLVAELLLSEI